MSIDSIQAPTSTASAQIVSIKTTCHQLSVYGVRVFCRSHLAASVVQQFSLSKFFSSIAFKRKVLFRGHDISEEPSPAEVDTRRCHVLDKKVDL